MEQHSKGTAIVLPALALCASLMGVALAAAVVGATGWISTVCFLGLGVTVLAAQASTDGRAIDLARSSAPRFFWATIVVATLATIAWRIADAGPTGQEGAIFGAAIVILAVLFYATRERGDT